MFSYQLLGLSRGLRARTKATAAAPHSFLWIWKLNSVLPSNPQKLYRLLAESINAAGKITGFAVSASGDLHGFLAIPSTAGTSPATPGSISTPGILSNEARKLLFLRLGVPGR